jgi:hypothetical protein
MFLENIQDLVLEENCFMFQTHYSVGCTATQNKRDDCVFAVGGVPESLGHLGTGVVLPLGRSRSGPLKCWESLRALARETL